MAEAANARIDSAENGRALVYVIGSGTRMIKLAVAIDGRFVGITGRNDYIAVSLDPGVHHICATSVKTKSRDALLQLTVAADQTYYVKQDFDRNGGWYYSPPRLWLLLLDADQGADAMTRAKPAH